MLTGCLLRSLCHVFHFLPLVPFPSLALGWSTTHRRQVRSNRSPQRATHFPAVGDNNRKVAGHWSPNYATSKNPNVSRFLPEGQAEQTAIFSGYGWISSCIARANKSANQMSFVFSSHRNCLEFLLFGSLGSVGSSFQLCCWGSNQYWFLRTELKSLPKNRISPWFSLLMPPAIL